MTVEADWRNRAGIIRCCQWLTTCGSAQSVLSLVSLNLWLGHAGPPSVFFWLGPPGPASFTLSESAVSVVAPSSVSLLGRVHPPSDVGCLVGAGGSVSCFVLVCTGAVERVGVRFDFCAVFHVCDEGCRNFKGSVKLGRVRFGSSCGGPLLCTCSLRVVVGSAGITTLYLGSRPLVRCQVGQVRNCARHRSSGMDGHKNPLWTVSVCLTTENMLMGWANGSVVVPVHSARLEVPHVVSADFGQ